MGRRRRREVMLDGLTALAAIAALTFVARERVLPWLAERAVVDPGELIRERPRVLDALTGDSIALADGRATLLFVFRSTCPACTEAAPAWTALANGTPWSSFAVGLEPARPAARYASTALPRVRAVVPPDPADFARRFRIRVVPTTLAIDESGRLLLRRAGPLDDDDLDELRKLLHPDRKP